MSTGAIASHPDNRELLAARSAGVLSAEDDLFIPAPEPAKLQVRTGETHYLVYKPATRILHLVLQHENGEPRQTDYTLCDFQYDGPQPKFGRPFADELYGFAYQGVIQEALPAAVSQLKLTLEDAPDDPIELHLGRLDPPSTTRGLKARLQSLGLYHGDLESSEYDAELHAAVQKFQREHGLAATGAADGQTRERLAAVCSG